MHDTYSWIEMMIGMIGLLIDSILKVWSYFQLIININSEFLCIEIFI